MQGFYNNYNNQPLTLALIQIKNEFLSSSKADKNLIGERA